MNKFYYYEVQEKIQDFESILGKTAGENKIIAINEENQLHNKNKVHIEPSTNGENFLNEYEIISNDEFDEAEENEIVDLTKKSENKINFENSTSFLQNFTNDGLGKLHLNLNASKISLKSQTKNVNKPITSEIEVFAKKDHQTSFKHAPMSCVNDYNSIGNVSDDNESSNSLPEIVFTTFEKRESVNTTMRHTMKKSATVTFQTIATSTSTPSPTTPISPNTQYSVHQTSRSIVEDSKLKALSPPPYQAKHANSRQQQAHQTTNNSKCSNIKIKPTTTVAEVYEKFRQDSEDSSELNSQLGGGGNSTSPESLIDNILSAASSVSVCDSSTNSSAATEVRSGGELDIRPNSGGSGVGGGGHIDDKKNNIAKNESNLVAAKEIAINSSLNSKSKMTDLQKLQVSPPGALPTVRTPVLTWLHPPDQLETASIIRSRSPSPLPSPSPIPSPSPSARNVPDRVLYPEELKCQLCGEPFQDPRTLNCLHSFCFQCLVNENFKADQSIPFWSQPNEANEANSGPTNTVNDDNEWKSSLKSNYSFRSLSPETTVRSYTENGTSPFKQRRSSFSFRRKKSQERIILKTAKSDGRASENSSTMRLSTLPSETDKDVNKEVSSPRFILCKACNFATELPIGGLRQLPKNFLLLRKIEEHQLRAGDDIISKIFCSLCFEDTNATYHCVTCTLNLCTLDKEAHERQRSTANHKIKNIMELRRARKKQQSQLHDYAAFTLKCGMHGFDLKSFCTVCMQVACADCLVLLHKGHKHEIISKAIGSYTKILNTAIEQTRPLCGYAEHSIERLNMIVKDVNRKCDEIQAAVEVFMQQYFEALEAHRKTLVQQINRARESKMDMIIEQQLDMEKRSLETAEAVKFSQELREHASDVELLSFASILLKRFEYCQQIKPAVDPKISDSLHFLPKIVAPSTKDQNDITLYGIITMQTVDPTLCTLQAEGFSQLRLHKRVELTILTRDTDSFPLCHGGLLQQIQAQLKYKESSSKTLPIEISDNRDGTYVIAFTPDSQGTILLTININEKPIKGSPFSFLAHAVRPHGGIYHCCSFCSSGKAKGSKSVKCSCEGVRIAGYNGCGHGHVGHPGRRHWSCCGNVLENSECNVANKLLHP